MKKKKKKVAVNWNGLLPILVIESRYTVLYCDRSGLCVARGPRYGQDSITTRLSMRHDTAETGHDTTGR